MTTDDRYQGRCVVVTGAASGIGRALALAFARQGAQVAMADVDYSGLESVMNDMPGTGHICVTADLSEKDDLDFFADRVSEHFESIDVLVNNACRFGNGLLSECAYEDFNALLQLGVTAPYWLTLRFKKRFAPGASVINISSTRAEMSQEDTESYSAAKGALTALTHAMAMSLRGKVRVNAVSPGWINTAHDSQLTEPDELQHPVQRVGETSDVVNAVLFLSSPNAGFITGQNITVDGGMTKQMIYHGDKGWRFDA